MTLRNKILLAWLKSKPQLTQYVSADFGICSIGYK